MDEPDGRALEILLNTYWSPAGWRDRPEDHVTAEDFSFAVDHGVMFEPHHVSHDDAVAEAIAAREAVTPQLVARAFAFGLDTRRVHLRSGLGSYAATLHLAEHQYVPWMGRGPTCEVCGFYDGAEVDRNVLSFERFKWGGVRHLHIDYAAFDLQQLRRWFDRSQRVDTGTLERLLERWRQLGDTARARQASDAIRGLFPSNDSERRTVVEIAAIAGVLQPMALPSTRTHYVTHAEREYAHPGGRNDWGYPAFAWSGRDGLNEHAVAAWWGPVLARPQAPWAQPAQLERPPPRPRRPRAARPARDVTYPFVPKSNALLRPGQFWGIPLSDGRYACGRVLDIDRDAPYGSRTSFLAGLMDWSGDEPPTAESIAGCRILEQGTAHILTIVENGERVLGHRPLETDGLEPVLCLSAQVGGDLQRGLRVLRPATRDEQGRLPVLSGWGYKVIAIAAERHFVT